MLVEYERVLVLAADGAAAAHSTGLILQMPVLARVLLEVEVLVAALIEYQLRLIELALHDEVVHHAGLRSTDASRHLRLIYDPIGRDRLPLLLLEQVLLVSIRIDDFILLESLVEILRLHLIFDDATEILWIRDRVVQLVLPVSEDLLAQSEDVKYFT